VCVSVCMARFLSSILITRCVFATLLVVWCLIGHARATLGKSGDGGSGGNGGGPSGHFFVIRVCDSSTGNGVPLVMLRTVNYIVHWTDSAGYAAFFEPGMMGQPVFFGVLSDGYAFDVEKNAEFFHRHPRARISHHHQHRRTPRTATGIDEPPSLSTANALGVPSCAPPDPSDPFDVGVLLNTSTGGRATVFVTRCQPAERFYRLTGGGLYRDMVLAGEIPPSTQPLLDISGVVGQDTLMPSNKPYHGQQYYFFGDSACPRSRRQDNCLASGMYSVGAISCVRGSPGCATEDGVRVNLTYFVSTSSPDGFTHPLPMAPIPPLNQNTWIGSITVAEDSQGNQVMFALFTKPASDASQKELSGALRWNDSSSQFDLITYFPVGNFLDTCGISSGARTVQLFAPRQRATAEQSSTSAEPYDGDGYVYLGIPFAYLRVPPFQLANLSAYEAFTPLLPGSNVSDPVIDPNGWGWKLNSVPFQQSDEAQLIAKGILPAAKAHMQTVDVTSGAPVFYSLGSVNFNAALQQYLVLSSQGSTMYVSLSPSLMGPYRDAFPVAWHNSSGSSCYNPLHMPWLDEDNGRVIYFACSFTAMWSDANNPNSQWYTCLTGINARENCAPIVPRYEYNNLVYRLDVSHLKEALLSSSSISLMPPAPLQSL